MKKSLLFAALLGLVTLGQVFVPAPVSAESVEICTSMAKSSDGTWECNAYCNMEVDLRTGDIVSYQCGMVAK